MTVAGGTGRGPVKIRRADWAADHAAIERLMWDYRDLLVSRTGHVPSIVEAYYGEGSYAALIDDLPRLHARPTGNILVADTPGGVTGCAMYLPQSGKTCEIKRIFVDPQARGSGAATALIRAAQDHAAADGYDRMVLDTIHTLTEARALYQKLGFAPAPPFYDPDPRFADTLRFYAAPLNRPGS